MNSKTANFLIIFFVKDSRCYFTKKLNRSEVQVHFFYRKPQVPATVNFRDPTRRFLRRPCLAWRTRLNFIFSNSIDLCSQNRFQLVKNNLFVIPDLDIFIKIKQFYEITKIVYNKSRNKISQPLKSCWSITRTGGWGTCQMFWKCHPSLLNRTCSW